MKASKFPTVRQSQQGHSKPKMKKSNSTNVFQKESNSLFGNLKGKLRAQDKRTRPVGSRLKASSNLEKKLTTESNELGTTPHQKGNLNFVPKESIFRINSLNLNPYSKDYYQSVKQESPVYYNDLIKKLSKKRL